MKTYYIPNSIEIANSIYGDESPVCIDLAEVERLACEWEISTNKLLDQMHEASAAEIDKYGTYDS